VTTQPVRRVVFDTNVVLSALLFSAGRLAWLRLHWREPGVVPLISSATARELMRIVGYPKFRLSKQYCIVLMEMYLPHCETVEPEESCPVMCRDPKDQSFLDLAHCGKADLLVTGDEDLLALAGQTAFVIETPEAYLRRASSVERNR